MAVLPVLDITEPVRRNRIIIFSISAVLTFVANVYGLFFGITVVFSHLLYFPIILAGYWFPRRGILFAACIAAVYGITAFLLSAEDLLTTTAIISRCAIFLVIGTVVSLISLRLHESERQLHDIIEFLPDPTFAVDPAGRVIAWNKAIEEMTGIKKSDMLGRGNYEYALPFYGKREPILVDRILNEHTGPETKYLNAGKESGRLVADVFIPHFRDGRGAHLRLAASALFDSGGRTVGAIESIRDVTDQFITDAALQNTSTRLTVLAGIIRNDIGKKLSVLYQTLSAGSSYPADSGFNKWVSTIRESADGIRQQIEISGAFRDIGTTPPGWLPVQEAVTRAAVRAGFESVSFRAWTERLEVFSDTHIPTAFYHLFERSVSASTGATRVVVTYQIRKTGCAIIVEDDGSGYAEPVKEVLFRKRDDIFGCGLFLTKEILAITSMSIQETGVPGRGARFEILVPPEEYRISLGGTMRTSGEDRGGITRTYEVDITREAAGKPQARELTAGEFSLADGVWVEYHDTTGDPGRDRIFAVFVSGAIVSLARCRRHPDGIEVDGVFTRESFRHKGYSLTVMEALADACHNDELFMYAVRELVGFYAKVGFLPIPEHELPGSVRERYRWAKGNMEGVDVQPMHRPGGW